ncbi:MAG: DUF6036 family nucleotidyltransferase [Actinomycetota bacterium]
MEEFNRSQIEQALNVLGATLSNRRLRFELVAVGGSSLLLLGLIQRPTQDLDIVARVLDGVLVTASPLPPTLLAAVSDVAATLGLGPKWLNAEPGGLFELGLPEGFQDRLETRTYGNLVLHLCGRTDQIHFKLYAAADGMREKHVDDLRRLKPTRDELLAAGRWAKTHDVSVGFRELLIQTLKDLGVNDARDEL